MIARRIALVCCSAALLAAVLVQDASASHRLANGGHWDKFDAPLAYMKINDFTGSSWPVFAALQSWDFGANRITTTYVGGSSNCGRHCVNTAAIAPNNDPHKLFDTACTVLGWTETYKIDARSHFRDDLRIRFNNSCNTVLNQNEKQKAACHEIGHALGLDHRSDLSTCMHGNAADINRMSNSPDAKDFEVINQQIYTHPDSGSRTERQPTDPGTGPDPPPAPTLKDPSWAMIDTAGNADVFSINPAGALFTKWYTPAVGEWSGWLGLGAPSGTSLRGLPSAWVSPVTGNLEVYARDGAHNVQVKWYTPSTGGWSGWQDLGRPPGTAVTSDPVVVKDTAGNQDIFVTDFTGHLWAKWYTPSVGGWSGWLDLGAPGGTSLRGKPWAWVSPVTGNLEVYARDGAHNVQVKWYTPSTGGWSGWQDLGRPPGTAVTSDPVVVKDTAGNQDIFVTDFTGHLWAKWYTPSVGGWSGWLDLGAPGGTTLRGKPWAWVSPVTGNLVVYARDAAGNVQQKWYTPSTGGWSGWLNLGKPGPALTSDPVVIRDTAGNEVIFGIDSAGTVWEKWYTPSTGGWSGWLDLGAAG